MSQCDWNEIDIQDVKERLTGMITITTRTRFENAAYPMAHTFWTRDLDKMATDMLRFPISPKSIMGFDVK